MNESNTNQLYSNEIDSIFISLNKSSPNRVILTLVNRGEERATIVIPPPDKYGGERKEVRLIPGEPHEIVYDNVRPNYCWRIVKLSRNATLVSLCEIDMSTIQEGTPISEPLSESPQVREEPAPYISDISSGVRLTNTRLTEETGQRRAGEASLHLSPLQLLSSEQPREPATLEGEIMEESSAVQDSNGQKHSTSTQTPEERAEEKLPPAQQMEQQKPQLDEQIESIPEDTAGQGAFDAEAAGETWKQIQQIHQQSQTLVGEISDVHGRVIGLYKKMEEICRSSNSLYKALQRADSRAKQILDEIQHIHDDSQEYQAESTKNLNDE